MVAITRSTSYEYEELLQVDADLGSLYRSTVHRCRSTVAHPDLEQFELHDRSVARSVQLLIREVSSSATDGPVVPNGQLFSLVHVFGGHAMKRHSEAYARSVKLVRFLWRTADEHGRQRIFLCGGGPGAMEACSLGCWLACYGATDVEVDEALAIVREGADDGEQVLLPGYRAAQRRVLERFVLSNEVRSDLSKLRCLNTPTWTFNEPPNPFGVIFKFFTHFYRCEVMVSTPSSACLFLEGSIGSCEEALRVLLSAFAIVSAAGEKEDENDPLRTRRLVFDNSAGHWGPGGRDLPGLLGRVASDVAKQGRIQVVGPSEHFHEDVNAAMRTTLTSSTTTS